METHKISDPEQQERKLKMRLVLCDKNLMLCSEWQKLFKNEPGVKVICSNFEAVPEYDCIVSPANSFGIMDGGFDLALINYFGLELMKLVQAKIKNEYAGEQPVGTCLIVETGDKKHPYLAHTPTMRVPRIIREYDTIYNAMRAMLLAVQKQINWRTAVKIETDILNSNVLGA